MQSTTTEEQLNAFFGRDPHAFEAEEQLIAEITQSLRAHKADVSNKDLIFALIQLLEIEKWLFRKPPTTFNSNFLIPCLITCCLRDEIEGSHQSYLSPSRQDNAG